MIDDAVVISSANLTDDAFNRNMEMGVVAHDVPEIGLVASDKPTLPSVNKAAYPGCTCQSTGGAAAATSGVLLALGVLFLVLRPRRRI